MTDDALRPMDWLSLTPRLPIDLVRAGRGRTQFWRLLHKLLGHRKKGGPGDGGHPDAPAVSVWDDPALWMLMMH